MAEEKLSFEEELRLYLINNKEVLMQDALKDLVDQAKSKLRYQAASSIDEEMTKFFRDEIKPEIEKWLQNNKENIVASTVTCLKEVIDTCLKDHAAKMTKNLQGYGSNKLLELLSKGY